MAPQIGRGERDLFVKFGNLHFENGEAVTFKVIHKLTT